MVSKSTSINVCIVGNNPNNPFLLKSNTGEIFSTIEVEPSFSQSPKRLIYSLPEIQIIIAILGTSIGTGTLWVMLKNSNRDRKLSQHQIYTDLDDKYFRLKHEYLVDENLPKAFYIDKLFSFFNLAYDSWKKKFLVQDKFLGFVEDFKEEYNSDIVIKGERLSSIVDKFLYLKPLNHTCSSECASFLRDYLKASTYLRKQQILKEYKRCK